MATQLRKGDGSALASAYVQLIHTPRGKMKPHLHQMLQLAAPYVYGRSVSSQCALQLKTWQRKRLTSPY